MTKSEIIQALVARYRVPVTALHTFLADYHDEIRTVEEAFALFERFRQGIINRFLADAQARVETTEEAFALFDQFREGSMAIFRETAWNMLQVKPWTAARLVINQMRDDRTYVDHGNDCWTGAAFAGDDRFEQCGFVLLRGESYEDARAAGRRAHGSYRVSKWRLRQAVPSPVEEVLQLT